MKQGLSPLWVSCNGELSIAGGTDFFQSEHQRRNEHIAVVDCLPKCKTLQCTQKSCVVHRHIVLTYYQQNVFKLSSSRNLLLDNYYWTISLEAAKPYHSANIAILVRGCGYLWAFSVKHLCRKCWVSLLRSHQNLKSQNCADKFDNFNGIAAGLWIHRPLKEQMKESVLAD